VVVVLVVVVAVVVLVVHTSKSIISSHVRPSVYGELPNPSCCG
jgi:hypothetical protein